MFILKRWYFLLLIFVLILSLTIWLARTQLAELVISSAMFDAGLANITINIHQLDINQSKISQLKFTLLTETGPLHIEAHDINISYKPEKVIKGRIEKLLIDKLIVDYEKTTKTQNGPADTHKTLEPLKIIEALTHILGEYIFFNTLHVQHIILNGAPFAVLHGKTLQLKSTSDDKSLYAEITLLNPPLTEQFRGLPQLVISSLAEGSLSAELRHIETSSAISSGVAAKLELNIHDTELTGDYHINPQSLQSWLQPFTDVQGINEIENVNGTLFFDFASDKHITDKQIIATITAASDKLVYKTYSADNAVIKLKLKSATVYPVQRIQLLNGSYIKAGNFKYDNFSLKASRIYMVGEYMVGELTTSADNWLYKGGFRSDIFAANYESQLLQIKDIAARFMANSEKLEVSGNFSPETVPGKFTFALDQGLTKSSGKLSIKPLKPLDLNAENSRLSQLLTPWPYPFDLLSGDIKLTSDATWTQKNNFRLSTKIKFNDVGGHVGELVFSGLSFDHELEILPELQSIQSSKINLFHIDSGVILSNISTGFAVKTAKTGPQPQFVIQGLHGEIFGGTFSGENLIYDLNRTKNSFKIKATNINLAEIVKTQQLKDITATGRIDGFIPVEINENGISIEDGVFINDIRSGTIRYNPSAGTNQLRQNPLTGIALDALRDFRYSHLSAGVNYTAEGILTINLRLIGTSPELDTNRPVHLNINTEQNLLSLLKSLRYAQGVSESIDKKVRRLYEKTQK